MDGRGFGHPETNVSRLRSWTLCLTATESKLKPEFLYNISWEKSHHNTYQWSGLEGINGIRIKDREGDMILVLGTRPLFRICALQTHGWRSDLDTRLGMTCGSIVSQASRERGSGDTNSDIIFTKPGSSHRYLQLLCPLLLSVVIHFSAKSPENNVNQMLPPSWYFTFSFFGNLSCCVVVCEKHIDENKIFSSTL